MYFKKKIYISLTVLVLLSLPILYKSYLNRKDCGFSQLIKLQTTDKNLDTVGKAIAEKWLDRYVCKGRIRSYSINSTHFGEEKDGILHYAFSYSVKPGWLTEDFILGGPLNICDDFVQSQCLAAFMAINKDNDTYTFLNVSSGP